MKTCPNCKKMEIEDYRSLCPVCKTIEVARRFGLSKRQKIIRVLELEQSNYFSYWKLSRLIGCHRSYISKIKRKYPFIYHINYRTFGRHNLPKRKWKRLKRLMNH